MKRNFKIDQMIAIVTDSGYYDMHNNYDFLRYHLTADVNKRLDLFFERTNGDWINESDPQKITVTFTNIYYLKLNLSFFDEAFDDKMTLTDLNGIDCIAFKEAGDTDMNSFAEEKYSEENYHIIFYIDDMNYIRVYADEANVSIE